MRTFERKEVLQNIRNFSFFKTPNLIYEREAFNVTMWSYTVIDTERIKKKGSGRWGEGSAGSYVMSGCHQASEKRLSSAKAGKAVRGCRDPGITRVLPETVTATRSVWTTAKGQMRGLGQVFSTSSRLMFAIILGGG